MKLRSTIAALHAALLVILLAVSPAGSGSMALLGVGTAPGGGGGACGGFTPASLGANLIGWFKADVGAINGGTGIQATAGQSVDTWNDQSGNGYTLGAHLFASPVMSTLGGKPALLWDATNAESLSNNGNTSGGPVVWGTGTTGSIFTLVSATTTSGGGGPGYTVAGVGNMGVDANSASWPIVNSTPSTGYTHAFDQQFLDAFTASTELRIGGIFDGTNYTPYVNNVAGTTHAVSFSFGSPGNMQANSQSGIDGLQREIIFVNKALNSTERSNLDCYLASRM